jgi:hypothetical protein
VAISVRYKGSCAACRDKADGIDGGTEQKEGMVVRMSGKLHETLGISDERENEIADLLWGWIGKYGGASEVLNAIMAAENLSTVEKYYIALKFGRALGLAEGGC